ncbi:bifunctional ADP-dependent NAD(P)H-hydrate dehydratase/NAD(P)H-hydrate epimerase [Clostridiaceae bacterium 14S0207]|nr:bifunctional ADP-dependent NAD(P)H-hydrate dehydratase/NAD(P)H-hydrate epimerase [Clostridiaceae bacterium 14S0207]
MIIGQAQDIRELDKYCIEELKIPSIILMENAALKVLKNISIEAYKEFIVICGKGNNGGDALALGRQLIALNKKVKFFIIGDREGSKDFNVNYQILKNINADISEILLEQDIKNIDDNIKENSLIIDGIFGTGLKRNVEGMFEKVIELVNRKSNDVIAIDIPSGLHSDTGDILGCAIKATKTISFVMYKRGFLSYEAFDYLGDVIVEEIGMPLNAVNKFNKGEYLVDDEFVRSNFKHRNLLSHKGDFGKDLIFSGSKGFTGAAIISSKACVKSGAGLVRVCCDQDVYSNVSSRVLEAMCIHNEDEKLEEYIKGASSIAFGPGMGNNECTLEILKKVLMYRRCPIVIDADGINVLQNRLDILKENNSYPIILTPHLGEMSRLTGIGIEEIKKHRIEIAKSFAQNNGVIVLLKGYNTIITDGKDAYINTTGNSSMANGGMGDCLTGIITSFIGQDYNPMLAAVMGAYIHGFIGEELSKDKFVVTAEDINYSLPRFLNLF